MNGSKIRTWGLLIRACAGGKRTSVLVLSSPALLGRGCHVVFTLGELREGIGVRSKALFTFVFSPFCNLLALKHSEFFQKAISMQVWSLAQETCIFSGRPKSLQFASSWWPHILYKHKGLTSPGFRNQLSLCEALLQLKGTIWQRWHQNFLFNMKKNPDKENSTRP